MKSPIAGPMPERRIAHLDMDAFFASVELLHYPELKGKPVVIGGREASPRRKPDGTHEFARLGDYAGRGVITTSTYEARTFGVYSAMGMMKAAKLAPDAVLLPVNFAAYRDYSRRFKAAVAKVAPCIEDRGIDEIYIDLTASGESDIVVAQRIKNAVHEATGLSCSIAIAPNKLLAKIGSDLDKPDGLTLLRMDDVPARVWPLSVRKINGIGPKSGLKLNALGIETVGQLAKADPAVLQNHFGITYASWLLRVSRGIDERPVVTHSNPKSISRETTFERDLHVRHDRDLLSNAFGQLCARVADDLVQKECAGRTVGIKLRFENFTTVTRDLTLLDVTQDAQEIRHAGGQCLKRVSMLGRIRLLGVRVSNLSMLTSDAESSGPIPVQFQLSLY